AWGFGAGNGIGAGVALGLVNGDLSSVNPGTETVQQIIGHAGTPDANNTVKAATNIIELTGQQFSGPTDVAAYFNSAATPIFFSGALFPDNSAHMIVVYSDFVDGKTHVADLAIISNIIMGLPVNNTSFLTEHVSDLAIVGTPLDATAHAIHFLA